MVNNPTNIYKKDNHLGDLTSTHWEERSRHRTLEIQVLAWENKNEKYADIKLIFLHYNGDWLIDFLCFNATFCNILAISWWPVLVVEEDGITRENHPPWANNWYTLSLAAASRVHPFLSFTKPGTNPHRIGDRQRHVWVVR